MLAHLALSYMHSLKRKFFNDHTKERIFHYFDLSQRVLGGWLSFAETFNQRESLPSVCSCLSSPSNFDKWNQFISNYWKKKVHLPMLPLIASGLVSLFLIMQSWQFLRSYFKWIVFFREMVWRDNIWEGTRRVTKPLIQWLFLVMLFIIVNWKIIYM